MRALNFRNLSNGPWTSQIPCTIFFVLIHFLIIFYWMFKKMLPAAASFHNKFLTGFNFIGTDLVCHLFSFGCTLLAPKTVWKYWGATWLIGQGAWYKDGLTTLRMLLLISWYITFQENDKLVGSRVVLNVHWWLWKKSFLYKKCNRFLPGMFFL